jgi:hypothetical protein
VRFSTGPDGPVARFFEHAEAAAIGGGKRFEGRRMRVGSDLTHLEDPWKEAWAKGANSVITKEALAEYYSSIEPPSEQEG